MQHITIRGNVGRDPEARVTPNGASLCEFSVAVNTKKRGQDHTNWYRVTAWGRLSEQCLTYVHKGREVLAIGTFSVDEYTGKDGQARYSLEVNADHVEFIGKPGEDGGGYDDGGYGDGGYE